MSDITVPTNVNNEIEFEVTKEFTAVHIGSGSVSVLATPSMILFMEITSGTLAHGYLPVGYTTVGTNVCVDHLSAVLEGNKVISRSTITEADRKKIVFSVEVEFNGKIVGKGSHTRYIVDEKVFLENLNK